jgi:hypothetical protein
MTLLLILGIPLILGAISMLPLKASLYTSVLLLTGTISYYIIFPVVTLGEFPFAFFITGVIVVAVFTIMTLNNIRLLKVEQIKIEKGIK